MQPASTKALGDTGRQDAAALVSKWTRLLWVVLLLVLLGLITRGCQQARREARKNSCRNNLIQLGLGIQNYHDVYGALPPVRLVDQAGIPTHSWRTLISPYIFYNLETDYFAQLDLSKPWDDPANTAVLDRYVGTIQCPEREDNPSTKRTPYVAVVGEGTTWPEPVTADQFAEPLSDEERVANRKRGEKTKHTPAKILVVEWPESDIKWTEPSDLAVEEFIAWFEAQRGKPTIHPGESILYLGDDFEVHELPLATSRAEVLELLQVAPGTRIDEEEK